MTDANVPSGRGSAGTSTTLLGRIRAKEPEAWQRFVHLYGPLIYRWCLRSGLQEADAADLGQEVFQAVFRAIGRFEHTRGAASFRSWLKTITNNKIRDFARRRQGQTGGRGGSDAYRNLLELADGGGDAEDTPTQASDQTLVFRRAVELVLADFTAETRQAFLRVVVEGHDPADVARDLGMTTNAVYLAKSRVRRRLRTEFAGLIE